MTCLDTEQTTGPQQSCSHQNVTLQFGARGTSFMSTTPFPRRALPGSSSPQLAGGSQGGSQGNGSGLGPSSSPHSPQSSHPPTPTRCRPFLGVAGPSRRAVPLGSFLLLQTLPGPSSPTPPERFPSRTAQGAGRTAFFTRAPEHRLRVTGGLSSFPRCSLWKLSWEGSLWAVLDVPENSEHAPGDPWREPHSKGRRGRGGSRWFPPSFPNPGGR